MKITQEWVDEVTKYSGKWPRYTPIGSTMLYCTRRCNVLCHACAQAAWDDPEETDKPDLMGTYDEGTGLTCDNCDAEIEPSYPCDKCEQARKLPGGQLRCVEHGELDL